MADRGVRLFISCVSDEFGAYRDALRHALTWPNVEVKIQEDFKALGGDTLHMLEDYIEQCEAVVHFVGEMMGSTPAAASVDDLIRRRPEFDARLAAKGLGRGALNALTYTQWEAWLAIGFEKDLLIVEPADDVARGPAFAPTDVSRSSQAQHLKQLRTINRYPGPPFTSADNLIATIVNSAVTEALVKARIGPVSEKRQEPFGATIAAVVGGIFVLFIDKLLPLEKFFGELPIFVRLLPAVAAALFAWLAWRYWDTLGGAGEAPGSRERGDYDTLVAQLQAGGNPARVYRDWLTKALDRVDAFFGDPERNDKSWFARKLGLETPGARWTAPAFDRCLLLALLYPVVTIIGGWAWFGHVGIFERTLGLWESPPDDAIRGLARGTYTLSLAGAVYAGWRFSRSKSFRPRLLWIAGLSLAGAIAFVVTVASASVGAGGGAGALAFALAFAFAYADDFAVAFAFVFAAAIDAAFVFTFSAAFTGPLYFLGAVGLAVSAVGFAVVYAVALISLWSGKTGRRGAFLSLFLFTALALAYSGIWLIAQSDYWHDLGAVVLVFGVLTLVNAPFDWTAIGLTRALLRRGLAPGGRGPYFYAAVDAILAPPVITLLAFVTVLAVQTFDDLAVLRAGAEARILPLGPLYEGLETRPSDPEFWWVWLMLFSTLIPSALNLCIAAASLTRGLPSLNRWIVGRMSGAPAIRDTDRLLLAAVLSGQIAGGLLATGLALYFIGIWFVPIWLPFLGEYIRDFSEALAAYNAPARIMMWFAGVR